MFTKRQIKILEIIIKNFSGINSSKISENLNVTTRTIRNDIASINNILISEKSFKINSSTKIGYFIDEKNIRVIREIICKANSNSNKSIEGEERYYKIIGNIFFVKNENIFSLTEELFLSEQTIYKDVNKIKKYLSINFNYKFIEVSAEKILNKGQENNIRQVLFKMLSRFIFSNSGEYLNDLNLILNNKFDIDEYKLLYLKVKELFEKENIEIDDKNFDAVVGVLYIVIIRNRYGFKDNVSEKKELKNRNIVKSLIKELKDSNYEIEEIDEVCLDDFLWCIKLKKCNSYKETISSATFDLINEFLKVIMEKHSINIRDDIEVLESLTEYVEYMLRRVDTGFELINPMKEDVKGNYPYAYEIATTIIPIIYRYKNKYPIDDEISYIAINIEYYLEKTKYKLKTIIVNDSNTGINNILKNWLLNNFSGKIEIINFIPQHLIEEFIAKNNIDLIISGRNIDTDIKVDNYTIDKIPNKNDYMLLNQIINKIKINHKYENLIERMLDVDFIYFYKGIEAFEDIVFDMSKKLEERNRIYDLNRYVEDVLSREKNYPTNIGKYFVIPHPLATFARKTTISVAVLEKPIIVNDKEIELIFLLAIENKMNEDVNLILEFFKKLAPDKNKLNSLIKSKNKEEFMKKIINLAKNIN